MGHSLLKLGILNKFLKHSSAVALTLLSAVALTTVLAAWPRLTPAFFPSLGVQPPVDPLLWTYHVLEESQPTAVTDASGVPCSTL